MSTGESVLFSCCIWAQPTSMPWNGDDAVLNGMDSEVSEQLALPIGRWRENVSEHRNFDKTLRVRLIQARVCRRYSVWRHTFQDLASLEVYLKMITLLPTLDLVRNVQPVSNKWIEQDLPGYDEIYNVLVDVALSVGDGWSLNELQV